MLHGTYGDLFVGRNRLPQADATVTLGLKKILFTYDVTVEGLRKIGVI